eukprot:COSAG01_NODE_2440_length_7691_cov_12.311249_5_plen_242_part_00
MRRAMDLVARSGGDSIGIVEILTKPQAADELLWNSMYLAAYCMIRPEARTAWIQQTSQREPNLFVCSAETSCWVRMHEEIFGLPDHWSRMDRTRGDFDAVKIMDGTPDWQALEKALTTDRPESLGQGQDCSPWPATIPHTKRTMKLAAAWRIQNPSLHEQFKAKGGQIAADIERGPPGLLDECIEATAIRPILVDMAHQLPGSMNESINEHMLLTGIPIRNVFAVLQNGLNERYSGGNKGA